jgi:ATP-dependent helicase/nuclease subunit B
MLDEPWLPEEEARAAAKVRQVIAGLSGLGAIEPTADLTALRLTLELELADDLPRQGRSARGCWWDRWVGAIGLDADVAFMAGLAEGMVPERLHEDGCCPNGCGPWPLDSSRRCGTRSAGSTGTCSPRWQLRLSGWRRSRAVTCAAARRGCHCAGCRRRCARWPASRGCTHRSANRSAVRGWPVPPSMRRALPARRFWPAHIGVSGRRSPGTAAGWRTRSGDVAVARAVAMIGARASDRLTRYPAGPGWVVSPTALEAWARCPHAYFHAALAAGGAGRGTGRAY